MKIIKESTVYVQRGDLTYLDVHEIHMPNSIASIAYGMYHDYDKRYEFIEFQKPEEIEFFKNMDCILDYNLVKDMSCEQIVSLSEELLQEKERLDKEYQAMDYSSRARNGNILWQSTLLNFKRNSLNDILLFKKGELEIILPDGIEYPERVPMEGRGLKSLVRSMFHRKK